MSGVVVGTSFNGMAGFNTALPLANVAASAGTDPHCARIDHTHPPSTASSANFASLTSGTNTTATMIVGSGGDLGYTGTGVINASALGGQAPSYYYPASNPAGYITITSVPVVSTIAPLMDGTAVIGASGKWADGAHVHPTDTSRQASYANLTTIGSLANTAGLLRNDGAGVFTYDTTAYLSGTKVDSFNTRTGPVTLSSADVTGALGFTPYNATNPAGYTANTGTVTTVSVASANGFTGTVATPGTTPAITLTTSVTGLLKGNGTAISAAASADVVSALGYTPVNKAGDTGIGNLSMGALTATNNGGIAAQLNGGSAYQVSQRFQASPADPTYYTDLAQQANVGFTITNTNFGATATSLNLYNGVASFGSASVSMGALTATSINDGVTVSSNARNRLHALNAGTTPIILGWIACAFGDTSGDNVVIGQDSGRNVIGGHNGNLNAWSQLNFQGTAFNFRDTASNLILSVDTTGAVSMGALTATSGAFSSTVSATTITAAAQINAVTGVFASSITAANVSAFIRLGSSTGSNADFTQDFSDGSGAKVATNPNGVGDAAVAAFIGDASTGNQKNRIKIFNMVGGSSGLRTPSGGGYLFTEAGALKYKGSSGTVTTIAPA